MEPMANLRPWRVIAKREFQEMAGGRAFLVTTILGAVLIFALSFVPALIQYLKSIPESPTRVVTANPAYYQVLVAQVKAVPESLRPGIRLQLDKGDPSWDATQARLDPLVRKGKIKGYLWIGRGDGEELAFRYVAKDPGTSSVSFIRQLVQPLATQQRAARLGIPPQALAALAQPVSLATIDLAAQVADGAAAGKGAHKPSKGLAGTDSVEQIATQILSYFLLMSLYMAILLYGNSIAMSVINEKTSRVVELLVASAKPWEILLGKVLGVGLAGLVQFGAWVATGVLAMATVPAVKSLLPAGAMTSAAQGLPLSMLLYFALFFFLGYFMYAALYAGFTATASRLEEVSQGTLPITLLIIAGFAASAITWGAPGSIVGVVGSLIPFFAPMAMFTRVVMGTVPSWQIWLSIALMVLTIWGSLWLGGRLYRANVMRFRRVSWWRALH
ncbi:MAG: ABC transporter permease [Firmicutes bacterium]|nr:ABC transporter permease [Bacillota bacterium]